MTIMGQDAPLSFSGIDHIGIAVADLEAATKLWRDMLSLPFKGLEEIPEQKVKVAIFEVGGTRIELLAPTSADSPIAKFLTRQGERLHHIALRAGNCQAALEELERRGILLLDKEARLGTEGTRIGFLHPQSLRGVLVEIVER
jgi:methylmalonyl-CoA/ethylmalonyl-CoA epimerase